MHLAELNISIWNISPESSAARDFVDNVAKINALAERTEGFVWRLIDENRDADGNCLLGGPNLVFTLSVWESAAHLKHFVWNTLHKRFLNRKSEWFEKLESHHLVLWPVEIGHQPSLEEAKERLEILDANGDTEHAFGWSLLAGDGEEKRFAAE